MVLVNWSPEGTTLDLKLDQGITPMWVKISASWATVVLYTWSVIAPIVFPDRDFT